MKSRTRFHVLPNIRALLRVVIWLGGLTVPFVVAWNHTLVPISGAPSLDYWRGFGGLVVWQTLCLAAKGVPLQLDPRASSITPIRKRRARR